MKQPAMTYQADQAAGFIFDGYMPDVPPVHHAGGEINQIIGLDGE